jgi:hypothetical protein
VKRFLAFLGLVAIYCAWRRRHDPRRQPLGGFRCMDCWRAFANLEEAGYRDGGHVDPRRIQGPRTRPGPTRVAA